MTLPTKHELHRPVVEAIAGGASHITEIREAIRRKLAIPDDEWSETLDSGGPVIYPRINWARFGMEKAGFIRRVGRGAYAITEEGKSALASGPPLFDEPYLKTIPGIRAYHAELARRRSSRSSVAEHGGEPASEHESSPDERLKSAVAELDLALADELAARLQEATPAFFEVAVVKLLEAMGYGRGREGAGKVMGRSVDGGIDGLIDEDALGLDRVYMQAKRYAPDKAISRPAIQQFVGSLTGEGATKGVFVTTSRFTAEAKDYAERVAQRVILIDGDRFARLMIAYGVGVRTVETV